MLFWDITSGTNCWYPVLLCAQLQSLKKRLDSSMIQGLSQSQFLFTQKFSVRSAAQQRQSRSSEWRHTTDVLSKSSGIWSGIELMHVRRYVAQCPICFTSCQRKRGIIGAISKTHISGLKIMQPYFENHRQYHRRWGMKHKSTYAQTNSTWIIDGSWKLASFYHHQSLLSLNFDCGNMHKE